MVVDSDFRFSCDWFSNNIPVWEATLAPRFQHRPNLHFLEIGSFEGRSACWLLQNILTHESSRLTCIDLFSRQDEYAEEYEEVKRQLQSRNITPNTDRMEQHFDHNIRALNAQERVTKYDGPSAEVLRTLPLDAFDCIYIDGSHRAPNVLKDVVLSWDLLKQNGVMIFDDYRWNCFPEQPMKNPGPAIDAFLSVFTGQYEIIDKGYQILIEKTATIAK